MTEDAEGAGRGEHLTCERKAGAGYAAPLAVRGAPESSLCRYATAPSAWNSRAEMTCLFWKCTLP